MIPAGVLDLVILGLGGVGSAAAFAASDRGLRVTGVDRFHPPHDRGSTHGDTRLIRLTYFEGADYVPLLRRSYALWEELQREAGEELYVECGLLEAGPRGGALLSSLDAVSQAEGLALEALDAAAVAARFPGFWLPPGCDARFEARAGFLRVERCVTAHLRLANWRGVELRGGTRALGWTRRGPDHVEVELEGGERLATRRLVVCAGPWAQDLLADLGVPLRVARQPLLWFASDPVHSLEAGAPGFLFETAGGGAYYGFPAEGGALKVARHGAGELVSDPLTVDRATRAADELDVRGFLDVHLPALRGRPLVRHAVCMYTNSPDEHFLVDRLPGAPEVVFAAGLSGHGYKMASALGEALVALALDEPTPTPLGFLGLSRFAGRAG
ncbi:MAG: N-methyl-L-tryptophan oxidase [Planctomycetota bacterium]